MFRHKITLKEIPVNRDDYDDFTYSDVGGDRCFEIIGDGKATLGHVFVTENTETPNGVPCKTYIDWLELLSLYRGKRLLRQVMKSLSNKFGVLYFESVPGANFKYRKIGAESLGMDEITEREIFRYKA